MIKSMCLQTWTLGSQGSQNPGAANSEEAPDDKEQPDVKSNDASIHLYQAVEGAGALVQYGGSPTMKKREAKEAVKRQSKGESIEATENTRGGGDGNLNIKMRKFWSQDELLRLSKAFSMYGNDW